MITDGYLSTSRVVRGLLKGPFGQHIDLYIEQLQRGGYSLATSHHYLSLARGFRFLDQRDRRRRGGYKRSARRPVSR